MGRIKDLPRDAWTIAVPAFLAITFMAFTYAVTVGIGASVMAFVPGRPPQARSAEGHGTPL